MVFSFSNILPIEGAKVTQIRVLLNEIILWVYKEGDAEVNIMRLCSIDNANLRLEIIMTRKHHLDSLFRNATMFV